MTDEQKYDERIRSFYELYIFPSVKNWRNIVSNLESAAPDYIRGKNEGRLDQWEFLENLYRNYFPEIFGEQSDNSKNSQ